MTGFGHRWRSVFLVYRHLSFDEGDDKLIDDLSFGGPAVGIDFRF